MQKPKVIAFHLPQYHPIPENDRWWGRGFTEWSNVVKAKPLFRDHYQPHLPADLGFYDLRLPEARAAQAALAAEYGIDGFCYYHYWFNGRRVLERPVTDILASGEPDFPFCLCWANENWTRRWDGQESEILLEQQYSLPDDIAHVRALMPYFEDPRYIRVGDRPMFLVYRSTSLPNSIQTTDTWRREADRAGLPGLFLICVESSGNRCQPLANGFDAALEFQPFGIAADRASLQRFYWWQRARLGTRPAVFDQHFVYSYELLVKAAIDLDMPNFPLIRCVSPAWDNTARRTSRGSIFQGSTPELFEKWVTAIREQMIDGSLHGVGRELLFINAWNEWAEGNHLEPCKRWGRSYLEAFARGIGKGSE